MSRVSDKPYLVYVLWSASGQRFYTGISEDPEHRLVQHNSGQFKSWTSKYRPWTIVFTEEHPDYRSARVRELELKRQKGGPGFFAKTGLNPELFARKNA